MRIKALMLATAGLTVAGGSAYIAQTLINTSAAESSPAPAVRLVPVVIAASDIGFGQEIERTMLSTIKWPENALPPGVYTEFTDLLPQGEDEGRRARRAIGKGELVLAGKVSNFGEKVTIVQTLGPNRRAMAIKVDAETAVGGFVTPGDYVDVLLTQGREESLRAVTILQNIRVIGVESSGAPAMKLSVEAGHRITLDEVHCVIDGLTVKRVGENTRSVVSRFVDDIVTLPDEQIFEAVLWLMARAKLVAEGAAAAPVAALLHDLIDAPPGSKVVAVLSGGNLDVEQLRGMRWN